MKRIKIKSIAFAIAALICATTIALVVSTAVSAEAQAPEIEWVRQFGTGGHDSAYEIAPDSSGNVYVTGYTYGIFPGQTSAGYRDVFIAKYDGAGNQIWLRQFGTSSWDLVYEMALDSSGNVYVAGNTYGIFPGQTSAGYYDAFIAKYDGAGNQIWLRQFGTSHGDFARRIALDSSGNVYVSGGTCGGTFPGQTSAGDDDAFIAKYDGAGNQIWLKQFGTSHLDYSSAMALDSSGNIYVSGGTYGTFPGQTYNQGGYDVYVAKYDGTGNQLWLRQFGSSSHEIAHSIALDSSGNAYMTGYTASTLPGQTSAGSYDAFVAKYDGAGNQLWLRQFGSSSVVSGYGIALDFSGNAYVTGQTYGIFPGQTSAGYSDVFIAKLSGQVSQNQPPIADAGGPYAGDEGAAVTLDASGSTDPDGTIVLYEWDFDDDGIYDASSASPTITHTWGDDYTGSVTLRVTDNGGLTDTDMTTVNIFNLPPTVSIDSVEQPEPEFILPYHELTFHGSFTDPGWLDTHESYWDFGDGSGDAGTLEEENEQPDATGTCTMTYAYSAPGSYTVTLTVTDDDGGVGESTTTITVASPQEAIGSIDDYIQDLPADVFKNNAAQRQNALSEKLADAIALIDAGDYQDAIDKLLNDIRAKADGSVGGNPNNDWVTDPEIQQEITSLVDILVAYLQTLL
ncbi:MAG: SBBP repeat-containing protein [Desulfobacterales bacterium]|nr:SBBP repeat-containing protein [Desulfobacterales bacterium]